MNHLPERKQYLKEELKSRRYTGSTLVLLGCLTLLVWAVSDLVTRIDAVDGMLLAYFNLVKNSEISLKTAIGNLVKTPEAMKDLYGLLYLGGAAVLAFIFSIFHGRRSSVCPSILIGLIILFTGPGGTVLSPLLTVSFIVKAASAALLIAGSGIKIASIRRQKLLLSKKYEKKLRKYENEQASREGSRKKTYIPERVKPCK